MFIRWAADATVRFFGAGQTTTFNQRGTPTVGSHDGLLDAHRLLRGQLWSLRIFEHLPAEGVRLHSRGHWGRRILIRLGGIAHPWWRRHLLKQAVLEEEAEEWKALSAAGRGRVARVAGRYPGYLDGSSRLMAAVSYRLCDSL